MATESLTSNPVGTPAPGACPFCGSPDTALGTYFGEDVSHYILCRRCGAQGPHMGHAICSESEAIEAWNRRTRQTPTYQPGRRAYIEDMRAYAAEWDWPELAQAADRLEAQEIIRA